MRAVVIGAVASTQITVERLARAGIVPAGLVTLPLSLKQRHSDFVDLRPMAGEWGIPVLECASSNDPEVVAWVLEKQPDFVFVVGWSQILNEEFLAHEHIGVIGYHPSPLPRDRGRAVIPWTILLGRTETAGTLFFMDAGVDTGDVLDQLAFPVSAEEDAETLYGSHCRALGEMLDRTLPRLMRGEAARRPQDHSRATYCARRADEDGEIEWSQPAEAIALLIRATGRPYPGAFSFYRGTRIRFWKCEVVRDHPYIGLPGQIQAVFPDAVFVMCGDLRLVKMTDVTVDGGTEQVFSTFKIHAKFRRSRD